MNKLMNIIWTCKIWKDTRGQELTEYALMGGFVACVAGSIAPGIAADIIAIFGKLLALLQIAGASDFSAPRS